MANTDPGALSEDMTVWVKKFRLQKCWSQEQLAEMTGLSVRTIQRLEKGQPASMESLKALASVFEIDLSELQEHSMISQSQSSEMHPSTTAGSSQQWITREEEQAIAYVENVKGFYIHLLSFLVIMPALVGLNLLISPQVMWFWYVLAPWLVAFVLHAIFTFPILKLFGPEWEKREVEKRLGRRL